jgi:hypothetical protein
MSILDKYYSIRFLLLLLVFNSGVIAQNSNQLFNYYQNKQFDLVKNNLTKSKQISETERQFFEALFIKDAEQAFGIYEALFKKTEGKIKYYSAERIKDYYYAKGFYSTASDYEKYLVEHKALIDQKTEVVIPDIVNESPADTDLLYIQVGAFGLVDNANQMKAMLNTQRIESKIIIKEINSQKLYCVWVTGKGDFDETLKFANDLKQRYHLNFKIIKE